MQVLLQPPPGTTQHNKKYKRNGPDEKTQQTIQREKHQACIRGEGTQKQEREMG